MRIPCKSFMSVLMERLNLVFAPKVHSHDDYANIEHTHTVEDTVLVGQIVMWCGFALPDGWLYCDGSTYDVNSYPALASVLGPTYSVPPSSFHVPNLEGSFPIGAGGTYSVSQQGGSATHTLTTAEMPTHSHGMGWWFVGASYSWSYGSGSRGWYVAGNDLTGTAGSGVAHNNLPPYYGVFFLIYAGV
jgi:microcystin-dependent protein